MIGIALLLLAALIATSKLPTIPHAKYRSGTKGSGSVWTHPNLVFGALAIFAYVGAEVSIGSFLVNYFGQADIAELSPKAAAGYVSFYWGGAMIGRFLGAGLLRQFKASHLLTAFAICASSLVTFSMLSYGQLAMWSMLAVGFFNSIMFSLGVAELGPLTGNGSGILNMAIVGGAIVPLFQGVIADHIGIHHAFFAPVICYIAGGVALHLLRTPQTPQFMQTFARKGRFKDLMERIPIHVITARAALVGSVTFGLASLKRIRNRAGAELSIASRQIA